MLLINVIFKQSVSPFLQVICSQKISREYF